MRPRLSVVYSHSLDAADSLAHVRATVSDNAKLVLDAAMKDATLYTQRGTLNRAKLSQATGLTLREIEAAIDECTGVSHE